MCEVNDNKVTSVTCHIVREDGSEVKIRVAKSVNVIGNDSFWVDVYHKSDTGGDWRLCGDRPHINWRSMSVDDYLKKGRPECFNYVSHGEVLKTISMIGKTPEEVEAFNC